MLKKYRKILMLILNIGENKQYKRGRGNGQNFI